MSYQEKVQAARAATAEALKRVEENADPDWKDLAYLAVVKTATVRRDFISDDVWEVSDLPQTREDRALGPVFQRAKRDGICRKTDRVRPSVRSHMAGKPVWESQVFGQSIATEPRVPVVLAGDHEQLALT